MAINKTRSLIIFISIFAIIWIVNYFMYGFERPDSNTARLKQVVQQDEFLMGLQGKQGEGCVALKFMNDIDTVFIGSSHAYASLDPYVIRQASGGKRIGICALAAWNTDFLHEFVKFLSSENIEIKRLVWVADPATLFEITQHEKRLAYAQSLLNDSAHQKRISDTWIKNLDENHPPLLLAASEYKHRRDQHRIQINALSSANVSGILDRYPLIAERNLPSVIRAAQVNPRNEKNLRRFCADLKMRGIALDIVTSPVPERISNLVTNSGPELQKLSPREFLEAFTPCAQNVISKSLEEWGLDERYFVNRRLNDDYDYTLWEKPEEILVYYQELIPDDQAIFYSPDHVNPVGATIYSTHLGRLIGD